MAPKTRSATPQRAPTTRASSQQPALPAVDPFYNSSYGSRGKAVLRHQVRTNGTDSFNDAFEASRGTQPESVAEDEEDDVAASVAPSPAPKPSIRNRRGRPSSQTPRPEAETEHDDRELMPPPPARPDPAIPERLATALDAGVEYGGGIRGPASETNPPNREPHGLRVFLRTLPRYVPRLVQSANPGLKDLLVLISGLILLVALLGAAPLPSAMTAVRDQFFWRLKGVFGIPPYDLPPNELEEKWLRFRTNDEFLKWVPKQIVSEVNQWQVNMLLDHRLSKVEDRMTALEEMVNLQQETVVALQNMLPDYVVVRRIDDQWEIPPEFWQALEARLSDSDTAPVWQAFLKHNEQQLKALSRDAASARLDQAVQEKYIVSQNQFINELNENNGYLANKYHNDFKDLWIKAFAEMSSIAEQKATDVIGRSPMWAFSKQQLQVLTHAIHIDNAQEVIRTLNWFDPGNGARIHPQYTSPTKQHTSRWPRDAFLWAWKKEPLNPIMALMPWAGASDCWCAATNNGVAQLTVATSMPLWPKNLVVEHIPASASLDIAAAPRDIEIWVDTGSKKNAQRFNELMLNDEVYEVIGQECKGGSQNDTWVCVGRTMYDIHRYNHVQHIPTWAKFKEIGLEVTKILIQVNENWGNADHTCFYRLRMSGERVDGEDYVPPQPIKTLVSETTML